LRHSPSPHSTIYTAQQTQNYPASSLRFDWAVTLTSLWFIAGMFLDGWAHNNLASSLEMFFTPWHGVLYFGFFAVAGMLVGQTRNMARGHVWTRALPQGYLLALFGAALFSFGGAGDLVWHTIFGIESNMEALFSPTHLLLATGAMLFITGPVRALCLAGVRPTTDGEVLFEGYACDYHKATLRSYSYIAPPMVSRYQPGAAYLAAQGHVFVVLYAYGQAANWPELEDTAQQAISGYPYAPYGSGLYPCPPELAARAIR
jgi:hypothetical protein